MIGRNRDGAELFVQISHKSFRNIGLIGRPDKYSVVETLCLIHDHLITLGLNPVFDQETAQLVPYSHGQTVSRNLLGEVVDLVIVVGGDGSLLHAARALVRYNTPVIGINRGRLGFLTDIKPAEAIFKLDQVLQGHFQLDRRFLLEMEVRTNNETIYDAIALNDVVLHSGKSVHMIDFELSIDGQYVYRQHSDGLIVSTPTGSTAYALSAGGPIIEPTAKDIMITPICPHTLNARSIILDWNSEITVVMTDNKQLAEERVVTFDGETGFALYPGDKVVITKHPECAIFAKTSKISFLQRIRDKMMDH